MKRYIRTRACIYILYVSVCVYLKLSVIKLSVAVFWQFLSRSFNLSLSLGHDQGAAVSSLPSALQSHLAAVNHQHHPLNSMSSPTRTGRTLDQRGRTEHQGREESPKQTQVTGHRSKDRRRRQSSHSLPRTIHGRHSDGEDISEPATRGRLRQRETKKERGRRSKSEERRRQPTNEGEEETMGEEEQRDEEQEREKMHMHIREKRFAESNQKWNEKEKEKFDTKERELQNSQLSQEDETSRGNPGVEHYIARRDGQLKVESKGETKQMLPNDLGRERTGQRDINPIPYVGMSLPGQEKIQSNNLSAHESDQSPFSFLMSRKPQLTELESEMNGSAASLPKFSTYKMYSSGSIVQNPWHRPSLHTLSREMDRNHITGSLKDLTKF